jgi:carboxypeptidase Taq
MTQPTTATAKLEARFRQIAAVDSASGILHWDAATMLPEHSADARADQLAALAELAHEKLTDPALADWFAAAQNETPEGWQRANLDEMHARWQHATAVPQALVSHLTKLRITSEHLWRKARETSNYGMFLPTFRDVIAATREVASTKADALGLHPYDALLDSYDRGMRRSTIDPIFAQLKTWLPDFVGTVIDHQARTPMEPIAAHVPVQKQEALGRAMMLALGFDTSRGRIDVSAHPFCGGAPGDVRITTRYREDRFTDALYGVLHETGHALYEQGLPERWRGLPIGDARGMSMHESQSLFVEMQVSRSHAFLQFLLPQLQQTFGLTGTVWNEANVYRNLTRVERSFIRVNADEVTYPLHVIWRYELEQALLSGDLDAADLPSAWAEKTQHYLHITPPDDTQGCLQDIHWPEGMFGYFPTYTLGAMTAAQLMSACRRALPNLDAQIARGEFAPMVQWLRSHVHEKASSESGEAILRAATGEALNPAHFEAHLKARYLA